VASAIRAQLSLDTNDRRAYNVATQVRGQEAVLSDNTTWRATMHTTVPIINDYPQPVLYLTNELVLRLGSLASLMP
jgi:hypothetical protein